MAKLDFYFDTKKVNEDIANWRDFEIEISFEDEQGQGTLKSGSLEFVGELVGKINNWNDQGLYGGAGIFEAPPFRVEVCGSGEVIFDGGINTAECTTSYECDKVVAPLRSNKIDFLNDTASSVSFAYLASIGNISQSDYVSVPYVINEVPDFINVMAGCISLYSLIKESKEVFEKTVSVIAELSGDSTAAVTSAANPLTINVGVGLTVGRVLVDIVRIILYITYLFFMIQFILSLIEMVFNNLIQPIKHKKGMRVIDLFSKATAYFGFSLSSTLLNGAHANDVIIPRKSAFSDLATVNPNKTYSQSMFAGMNPMSRKEYDDNKNPNATGYFDGTFAELIQMEESRLNAEVRIIGNVFHFETKEYFAKFANYTLPNIQRKNGDPHKTNACELASNYLLSYSLDDQDTNTIDQYTGTSCQMQLVPNVILNRKNILLKNLTEVTLRYSLAKRKESLNVIEKIFKILYDIGGDIYGVVKLFVDGIVAVIKAIFKAIDFLLPGKQNPPNINPLPAFPANPLLLRIGCMLLSSDFTGTPKILVVDSNDKVHANNNSLTAAQTLMDELHFTNFAVRKITTRGVVKDDSNQWLVYEDKEIPFCCGDYVSVLNNNFIKTYDQKTAKVKSLVWNPYRETAKITYRVKEKYTNNLKQSYIIDGKP